VAPLHRPVSGFFHGRKGFGEAIDGWEGGRVALDSVEGSLEFVELVWDEPVTGEALSGIDEGGRKSGNREVIRVKGYEAPVYLTE
jgi:hypothetical protein